MKKIKLDDMKSGMVLAREVKGRFGRGLLSAGNMLTEKHIKIFKSWGITEIIIEKNPESGQEEMKSSLEVPAQYDRVERQLRELFKFNDIKHPAVKELFQISLMRRLNCQPPREI